MLSDQPPDTHHVPGMFFQIVMTFFDALIVKVNLLRIAFYVLNADMSQFIAGQIQELSRLFVLIKQRDAIVHQLVMARICFLLFRMERNFALLCGR